MQPVDALLGNFIYSHSHLSPYGIGNQLALQMFQQYFMHLLQSQVVVNYNLLQTQLYPGRTTSQCLSHHAFVNGRSHRREKRLTNRCLLQFLCSMAIKIQRKDELALLRSLILGQFSTEEMLIIFFPLYLRVNSLVYQFGLIHGITTIKACQLESLMYHAHHN